MKEDLSRYWGQLRRGAIGWVHPEDEGLLGSAPHSFNLDFPPPAFVGDVCNAPVIILVANGGYDAKITPDEFKAAGSEQRYVKRLRHPEKAAWSEVAPYYRGVNYADLVFSGKAVAVNACAYRSPRISNEPENKELIPRLPSALYHRHWLVSTVLPLLNAGTRFVVGKRHGFWGLPASITEHSGFIADPAPVSPHLSGVVRKRIDDVLARV